MRQLIQEIKNQGVSDTQIIYLNFEDYQIRGYKDPDALRAVIITPFQMIQNMVNSVKSALKANHS